MKEFKIEQKIKKQIIEWADKQDWNNAVNSCGATDIEQACISYRFAPFASVTGDEIDEALRDTKYYRFQQSIVNTESPILIQ